MDDKIEIDEADRAKIVLTTSGGGNVVKFGKTSKINPSRIFVGQGAQIEIAENCWLGSLEIHADRGARLQIGRLASNGVVKFFLHEKASITVGDQCLMASGVELFVSDMHSIVDMVTGERLNPAGDIHIGEHVWLASNVKVLKGVTIGRDTVVGANSVVTSDLPANCVAVGQPARVIREGTNWKHELI